MQIPAGTIDEKIYQRQLMKGELADAMQQEQGAKKAILFFFLHPDIICVPARPAGVCCVPRRSILRSQLQ